MLSLGFSLFLLVGWAVVGAAVLLGVRAQVGLLRSWLLAPAVGLGVQTLALCILNQAGWGTDAFAWPLEAGLVLVAGFVFYLRKVRLPGRQLWPFGAAVLVFLCWAGWPALRLGFNWISFVNDDFTNYCLSAERFRRAGFFQMPTLAELSGRDNTQYYFFMHFSGLMRFGSEQALALAASLVRVNALKVFMPVILAFGAAQICATAGLVLHLGRWRRHARWTAGLLAVSPLFIFGSLYQLIAQVGGLALMLATVALLTAPFPSGRSRWLILRRAIPTAVAAAALMIFYPEVTPFAALTIFGCYGLELLRTRRLPGARIVLLNFTLVGIFLLLRYNLVGYIYTLAHQAGSGLPGAADLKLTLFPFYLIPSGFAVLFGMQTLNEAVADPYGSIIIAIGALLFAASIIWAIRSIRRLVPIGCMLAIYALMTGYLFWGGNDFGLYKMAMFIQPALWAGIAAIMIGMKRSWIGALLAAIIVALGIRTTWAYTSASTGMHHTGMTELDHASEYLAHLPPADPGLQDSWVSNIENVVTLKLISNLYRGTDLHFLSKDFFNFSTFLIRSDWPLISVFPDPAEFDRAYQLDTARDKQALGLDTLWGSQLDVVQTDRAPTGFATSSPELSLFNKLNPAVTPTQNLFETIPYDRTDNLLTFVHSSRGNHYYLANRQMISFTQLEDDRYRPGGRISSVGRFFLFRVEHPSPEIYLRISASKTQMAPEHKLWSSGAMLQGATNMPLNFTGGGAVNKFVGPIKPVIRNGVAYVALDFDEEPAPFPIHRTGLAALYHTWIPLDYRLMVAFVRDISALSAEQLAALPIPRRIASFPNDLTTAKGLQFSGIYEDGWMSPQAEVRLGSAQPGECLRIRGSIPTIDDADQSTDTMTIWVNDAQSWTFPARPGAFDWSLPLSHPGEATPFRISFSSHLRLPGLDQRPIGGKLEQIAIEPGSFIQGAKLAWDGSAASLPSRGIDSDGWASDHSELDLPLNPRGSIITVALEYPQWTGVPAESQVAVSVDRKAAIRYALRPGRNELKLLFPSGQSAAHLALQGDVSLTLPGRDGRRRAFRLISVQQTSQ